jgi:hypothetical protein
MAPLLRRKEKLKGMDKYYEEWKGGFAVDLVRIKRLAL